MKIGELVWVRNSPSIPTWGIIVDRHVIYLTDYSAMVSYTVLVDAIMHQVDSGDLLQFQYYNRHLYNEMDT